MKRLAQDRYSPVLAGLIVVTLGAGVAAAQPTPAITAFGANPSEIARGQSSVVSWSTSNATNVTITDGETTLTVTPSGSLSVSPTNTTTYTLTASNAAGAAVTATTTVIILPPVSIDTFNASLASIVIGQSSTLSWSTSNATSVTITDGQVTLTVSPAGSLSVSPTEATTYTLTARDDSGNTATASVTITVTAQSPEIHFFNADPNNLSAGQSSTLSWSTSDAVSVSIDQDIGTHPASGSVIVQPAKTTTYTLTAVGSGSATASSSTTVSVTAGFTKLQLLLPGEQAAPGTPAGKIGAPRPVIRGVPFNVVVNAVDPDWNVIRSAADSVRLSATDRDAVLSGDVALQDGTATITITLNTPGNQSLTVTDVTDPSKALSSSPAVEVRTPIAPDVAVGRFPSGLVTVSGAGGAVDSYTLINSGAVDTTVTLRQSGDFFSQSPPSFELRAGQSQVVTITAKATGEGSFEGASIPQGDGIPPGLMIPVKLVAALPPDGTPDVRAVTARIDTNDTFTSGATQFRNDGTGPAIGVFVTDVPWLLPQGGALTIQPNQTVSGLFTIDRSKRPDFDTPIGSQQARFEFVYLRPLGASKGVLQVPNVSKFTAATQLIDTIGSSNTAGIPPFRAGEYAKFFLGVPRDSSRKADVGVVNFAKDVLGSLRFYFAPTGVSSVTARGAVVNGLTKNIAFGIADVVGNIFRQNAAVGSLQFRADADDGLAINTSIITPRGEGSLATAASGLRSDRAARPGESFFITGVQKSDSARTDIFVQEAARAPATVRVDFFDANGTAVSTGRPPVTLAEFSHIELTDVAPAGAVLAKVTNLPESTGNIVAEAHVIETSGERWNLTDWSMQSKFTRSETVVIPFTASHKGPDGSGTVTDVFVTNVGSSAASANLDTSGGSARRRAVASGSNSADLRIGPDETLSFAPMQTRVFRDVTSGSSQLVRRQLRLIPSGDGQFVVSSRTYTTIPGRQGTTGTSVPGLGASTALTAKGFKDFAGIEDSSAASIAERKGNTYRTSVGIAEISGEEVTIKLTVDYRYLLSSTTVRPSSPPFKEFRVRANELLMIDEVVRGVLGKGRDDYGDLHNVRLHVDVVGGNGAVIPFLIVTENATGDVTFRQD